MEEVRCNLQHVSRDKVIECRAICPIYIFEDRCCEYCKEINKCQKVCGFMRIKRGDKQ